MIKPVHLPPNSYLDDPAERIDRAEFPEGQSAMIYALASSALTFITEWITRGRGGKTNRALRADIVILSINPSFLPCKRPSAAWVARQHGVSRQRASELWREFASEIAPYIQFRGQHFRNRWKERRA
jgi:hypothetical protein